MSPMGGRPRILLADDDPRVLQVVSRYLDLEGYEMDTVADGEAAVETAAANPPDLIILDIMMPGIDGIEACRQIRANAATSTAEPASGRMVRASPQPALGAWMTV